MSDIGYTWNLPQNALAEAINRLADALYANARATEALAQATAGEDGDELIGYGAPRSLSDVG